MDEFNQDAINDNTHSIKTTKIVYPQVYSYVLPELQTNDGSQKIGYTERKDVDSRIYEQTHTAAFNLNAEKLWSAPAFFVDGKTDFKDTEFHKFLKKSGIENRLELGKEWFYFNGTPEKSKELYDTFRSQGFTALQTSEGKLPYALRTEQESAVQQAQSFFENNDNGEFLWNAKPRFGKTLATYDLAKRMKAEKVLIVTNRPAIANSWFDDYELFIDGYYFISETSSIKNRPTLTRWQYVSSGMEKPQITFLSLQDLKGSKYFGGGLDKLKWIADLVWDLLVIDEAHEGVDTDRTDAAFNIIKRKNTLHLSGTPFKALANNKFAGDAIFNWTYLDEQKIKKAELEEAETGDHTDLPNLKLFTYRISQMVADEVNEGIEIDDENRDYAFDLNEFFATSNQKFVREEEVKKFLTSLSTNKKYPFSTPELRDQLKHTFWYIGNRVDSVKALEQMLRQDPVFKDYKIVVAAGDGRSFEEEEDFEANEKSYDKVKKAIKENDKTITLSCGQLTTGVTIKEWNAVLMLTDIKQPAPYMQAAFRAQNPHKYYEDGELKVKHSAYLFDFAPIRVLEIYDQFANALNPKAVNGEITEAERKENIKELLNFFPVISEDTKGQMVELDAEKVLTFPNALAATEIVKARFMTNLLFNDNIKGVFHFPKEVEDILDKMPIEKNKRVEVSKKELDLDDARKLEKAKTTKVIENNNIILGEKIYRTNIERVVDNALNAETPEETIKTLPEEISILAEPVIAKYKEVYRATNAEIDEIKKETDEKIKLAVAEYEANPYKDASVLKDKLASIIEHDFVEEKVEQKETAVVENVQKTKEDEVRDHLRSFTRTIPMFIMANTSKDTITIDNFDLEISDEDFIDLTNITKDEFHKLRDGFDYTDDNGERQHFDGVFHKYKFNASIAEFVAEKQKRANYFETDDDIFELIPNQKNNQIFTPKRVVKMMVDGLEEYNPDLFKRTDSTFIDLYMKSGLYITEIVKKLFANTRNQYSSDAECVKHILENQVYGLAPTGVLHAITNSLIFGFDESHTINTKNFAQIDMLPYAKGDADVSAQEKLNELFNGGKEMKFDAVVGNPPYQETVAGRGDQPPIYNYFLDSAYEISDVVSMIHPARFLFNAGATPKSWNKKMLNDKYLQVMLYEQDSSKLFPNTDIKGGVAITLHDKKNETGGLGGSFIHFAELSTIYQKVKPTITMSIGDVMESNTSYKYSSLIYKENQYLRKRVSGGSVRYLSSSVFDNFKEIMFDEKPTDGQEYANILGRQGSSRVKKYMKRGYLNPPANFEKYKVFVPASNGSGAIGEVLSTPLIGEPLIGHTETFISIGAYDNPLEAVNLLKYIKSKFARTMLGTLKITQSNKSKDVWANVPLQDFTVNSDIDWSKSIPEIDQQLYKKYGLTQEEIDFIESRVKPME